MHARIAAAIKEARGKRPAQWLADRTAELGYPITRAQIANYETGRKKTLDIAELVVIAAALGTSPVALVYPGPYNEKVEVVPGREAWGFNAVQWFSALEWLGILTLPDGRTYKRTALDAREDWRIATGAINDWRRFKELEDAQAALILRGDFERDQKQIELYDKQIGEMRRTLGIGSDA